MATHSSILVWRIPWTEEPGGLQSMGSQRVRHNWAADTFTIMTSSRFLVVSSFCRRLTHMAHFPSFSSKWSQTVVSSSWVWPPSLGLLPLQSFVPLVFCDTQGRQAEQAPAPKVLARWRQGPADRCDLWTTVETVRDFIFLGSKITADGEINRCLLLGRKPMTNLDSILKSRDITLPTEVQVHLVKAMVFPVVMYGYES